MQMNFFRDRLSRVLLVAAFVVGIPRAALSEPARTYNFNMGWKLVVGDIEHAREVSFDDHDWKSVTLPRAFNEDDAFAKPIDELKTGVAWYRKHFVLPAGSTGKRVFVEFEGIRH